jgi:cytochrome b561
MTMLLKNTRLAYGAVAKTFHWVIFLLIATLLAVGFYMTGMAVSPDKFKLYGLHKSVGITVLTLAVLRLVWKAVNHSPVLPATVPVWERFLAHAGHLVLYFLMLCMPLSGWAMSSASGLTVSVFGWFTLPNLVEPDPALKQLFREMHGYLAWAIIVMVSLHILAALLHHFYYKNNVLRRMLPFSKEEKYAQDSDTMVGC